MRAPQHHPGKTAQRGAAMMVMLVILVMGTLAFLVSSLNKTGLKNEREKLTADALAQAKEALIGYALRDTNRPGELPCPDINNDGIITISGPNADYSGSNCISLIGRLPWKTLGLPDLRDSSGERLWYAISDPFHANASNILNSDTAGTLTVSGDLSASNVVAIVFAPGAPLCGKARSSSNVSDYLEAGDGTTTSFILKSFSDDCNNSPYNDNLLAITTNQIFQSVEKRIVREAKTCLDNYAAASASKYPWAAPVTDTSGYASTYNTFFGRLSTTPSNATSGPPDSSMSTVWPASCTLFNSSYWNDWRNLVFYQVADGYQPGGSASCVGCLSISGSGNAATGSGTYRAAVLVARRAIGMQARTSPATDPPTPYLEGINPHSGSTPATTFEIYNPSDPNYSTVNDLVLCLDGKNNCK